MKKKWDRLFNSMQIGWQKSVHSAAIRHCWLIKWGMSVSASACWQLCAMNLNIQCWGDSLKFNNIYSIFQLFGNL